MSEASMTAKALRMMDDDESGRWSGAARGAAADPDPLDALDEALPGDDEDTLRAARRHAEEKLALSREGLRAALITLPLLIFVPFLGALCLVYFGVRLGRRAFRLFYEPGLRERFVQEEVARRVRSRVTDERRHLEGAHRRSLEQLSASIAHEIRNPITAAKSLVQQMGEDPDAPDRSEYARLALAELERVERSVSHLLRFAREQERRVGPVVMEDVVESALETFRERIARGGLHVEREYDCAGGLEGDAEQLRRVVIALLSNAFDAVEEAGVDRPSIRVSLGGSLAGDEVWLRIADNGPGVEETLRERIFDPFVSARERGTGLGLALCRKIVDEHGGTIELDREAREGTAFVVTLPRTRPAAGGRVGRGPGEAWR